MSLKIKGLLFDLGGVLLTWDPRKATSLTPRQYMTIRNSIVWHHLDRGVLSLEEAYPYFDEMLGIDKATVMLAMGQLHAALRINTPMVQTIHDLKKSNPDLKLYIMSNMAREHFMIVRKFGLPWSLFDSVFISGLEGMAKPELRFFQRVIQQTGLRPDELLMIDDKVENICAAQSLGIQGQLIENEMARNGGVLRSLFHDPVCRAEGFMKDNAGRLHCIVEGQNDVELRDNFDQLLIWELTGDSEIVYLRYPSGGEHKPRAQANGRPDSRSLDRSDPQNGLWNYFYDKPVLTTAEFPPDANTTSTAYLALPEEYLGKLADPEVVLDAMAENVNPDGIMQVYFCKGRPRTAPDTCCNILRAFHRFGHGSDPRIATTEDWVVQCLNNRACVHGSRFHTTLDGFLYFAARLYVECSEALRARLAAIHDELRERIGTAANPLALALRVSACQLVGMSPQAYDGDLKRLLSLQDEDGGWPAGHYCRLGRTGRRIGSRGLTTALAMKIIRDERSRER